MKPLSHLLTFCTELVVLRPVLLKTFHQERRKRRIKIKENGEGLHRCGFRSSTRKNEISLNQVARKPGCQGNMGARKPGLQGISVLWF